MNNPISLELLNAQSDPFQTSNSYSSNTKNGMFSFSQIKINYLRQISLLYSSIRWLSYRSYCEQLKWLFITTL
jgi:hypothetical protein